jgi:hypothetical protein
MALVEISLSVGNLSHLYFYRCQRIGASSKEPVAVIACTSYIEWKIYTQLDCMWRIVFPFTRRTDAPSIVSIGVYVILRIQH